MKRKRDRLEWLACMLLASIALVYCIWVVPYIPTGDGPQHIYSAHVENHYSDAGSIYPDYYRILPQFAGKGFSLLYGPLESMMPWRPALRVAFSIMALGFAWGFALVVLSLDPLDPKRRPISLLGFVIALPWSLYMGFFAFCIGTTVGLYTLAFVLRRPPSTIKRAALVALLLLVQGVCHIFSAILTGFVIAVIAIASAPKGARLREAGKMVLVGLPAAGLLALTFIERNMQTSGQSVVEWDLGVRGGQISRWFVPGTGLAGWLMIALTAFATITTLMRARRGEAKPHETALAALALFFLVLSALAPIHIPGWQLFAPRFAVLAMVLGLAVLRLPEEASALLTRAALMACAVGAIFSSLASATLHETLSAGCAEELSGLDEPLHFTGPRFPILLHGWCGTPRDPAQSAVPTSAMAFNISLLYLVDHGGVAARLFNGAPSIHAIAFAGSRMPPPPPPQAQEIAQSHWADDDPKFRESIVTELATNGMPFEGIHVVGARPVDIALFKERGYAAEFERGSLFVARFEGCPAEVVVPAGSLDHDLMFYEYGLLSKYLLTPEPRMISRRSINRDAITADGSIHVKIPERPCGAVWVRIVWDADKSETVTPGDRFCDKVDAAGRMQVTVNREHGTITCEVPSSP